MDVFLVKDGVVENIVVVESMESAVSLFPDYIVVDATNGEASIGWRYAEGLFAPPAATGDTLEQMKAQLQELTEAFGIIEGVDA